MCSLCLRVPEAAATEQLCTVITQAPESQRGVGTNSPADLVGEIV